MVTTKKTLTILFAGIFLFAMLPMVSAGFWDFLNSKESVNVTDDLIYIGDEVFNKSEVVEEYAIININGWFGIGNTRFAGAISDHTSSCSKNCYSQIEIYLDNEDELIEDIRFVGDKPDEYSIWVQDGTKEVLVDDYEKQCENETREVSRINNETGINETYTETYQSCKDVVVGNHYETQPTWREYEVGMELPAGNYRVQIRGSKGLFEVTDWQIKTQGKWLEEWAIWDEDVQAYYKLDETTGDVVDATENGNDGTNNGATRGVTGKINNAFDFEKDNTDYVNLGEDKFQYVNDFTYNAWVNVESYTDTGNIIATHGNRGGIEARDNGKFQGTFYGVVSIEGGTINTGTWQMVTIVADSSNGKFLYIDGTEVASSINTGDISFLSGDTWIGGNSHSGGKAYFDGKIDEVGIWNRSLTPTEVSDLYNSGDGLPYGGGGNAPTVNLNSPIDNFNSTSQTITFNCSASDNVNLVNVSLYLDGSLNETNSSGINNTDYLFTKTISDGDHNWTCEAYDNESQSTKPAVRDFNVNTTPFIEFVPPTPANASNLSSPYIPVNVSLTETYFENVTFNFYKGGTLNESITFTDNTRFYNKTGCTCDNWEINVTTCTTTGQCNSTETRELIIDILSPDISTDIQDNYLIKSFPYNITWEYNASDPHIDTCSYNLSYVNSSGDNVFVYSNEVVTCNSTINSTISETDYNSAVGNFTFHLTSNDTFGNSKFETKETSLYFVNASQNDNPDPVAEGFDEEITLTINANNIPTTNANININDTWYSPTSIIDETNSYTFIYEFNVPENWGSTTGENKTWYWNYTINGVISNETTEEENLTIYETAIDDCSGYGETILNLSLVDEETFTPVNESLGSKIELELILTSRDNNSITYKYSNNFTDNNNPSICIPENILNTTDYRIDFTIGLSSTNRVHEFYYLDNGTLDESNSFDERTNKNITLKDLLTTDSTSFLFNYFDEDGLPVDNAIIHVYRKYIEEGKFIEVERAKSDQNGDTIVHLVEEDVIYYFIISNNGKKLYETSTYTALCQDVPCSIQIEASGETAEFSVEDTWDLVNGGGYTISSNPSTRKVNLTYEMNRSVIYNLSVYRYEDDGNYSLIVRGSDTGESGEIELLVPQGAGNVSFFSTVHVDNEYVNSEWVDFSEKASDKFGVTLSLFIAGLLILSLGLMAISSGVGIIVYVILGIMMSGALGLINTELSTGVNIVIYLVIAGGILIWKIKGGFKR